MSLNPGTPGERAIKGKTTVKLVDGDLVVIETSGGGDFGASADRPTSLVARDRQEGYA